MTALHTTRVSLPNDGTAYWLAYDSSTSYKFQDGGSRDKHRVLVWDTAGGVSQALYSGKKVYALFGFRLVDGNPGRFGDFHTQPQDIPHGWSPPTSPNGPATFVAPLALDYTGDSRGLCVQFEPEDFSPDDPGRGTFHETILTTAQMEARRGLWTYVWLEWTIGASWMPTDGRLRAWLAGEDNSPRFDAQNVNTQWWQQHHVTYWQGCYWSSGSPSIVIEHVATRFGRTPQECYEDVPVFALGEQAGSPTGSHVVIASRDHAEAAIPTDLFWGAGDTTAPVLQSAAILGAGSSLVYNEPLAEAFEPVPGDYVYLVNGSPRTVSSVNVVSDRVDLVLASPVVNGDTVTVSYTRASGREVRDLAGNFAANLSGQVVTNNTPPVVVSDRTAVARTTAIARVAGVKSGTGGGV